MKKTTAELTLVSPGEYEAQFTGRKVTPTYWLRHICWKNNPESTGGVESVVGPIDTPLNWYPNSTEDVKLGPFPVDGEWTEAWVWQWPDPTTPVSNKLKY